MRESLPIEPELRVLIVKHYPEVDGLQREQAIRAMLIVLEEDRPPNLRVVSS